MIDEKYLQGNRICLEPGQQVPQHNANSNVTLIVVHGEGTFHLKGHWRDGRGANLGFEFNDQDSEARGIGLPSPEGMF